LKSILATIGSLNIVSVDCDTVCMHMFLFEYLYSAVY